MKTDLVSNQPAERRDALNTALIEFRRWAKRGFPGRDPFDLYRHQAKAAE